VPETNNIFLLLLKDFEGMGVTWKDESLWNGQPQWKNWWASVRNHTNLR